MKRSQEQRFRKILEEKRGELLQGIAARRDRLQVDDGGDPIEKVRRLLDAQVVVRNVERMSATLRAVEEALREIDQGTFGRCAACDRPIPSKRLKVVPWSPYCVSCQERAEQAVGTGRPGLRRLRLPTACKTTLNLRYRANPCHFPNPP